MAWLFLKAVDLAKRFCDGAAPRIINGCLRTFVKDLEGTGVAQALDKPKVIRWCLNFSYFNYCSLLLHCWNLKLPWPLVDRRISFRICWCWETSRESDFCLSSGGLLHFQAQKLKWKGWLSGQFVSTTVVFIISKKLSVIMYMMML